MCHVVKKDVLVSTGNEKLWIHLKLVKTRFVWRTPPENHGYRHEERNQDNRTGDVQANPYTMRKILRLNET